MVACALDAADLVITLGFDMVEYHYHPRLWNGSHDKKIIHADLLPVEIDDSYHPELELVGDLAHTLATINANIDQLGVVERNLSQQSSTRADMQRDLPEYADDESEGLIRPQKGVG